MKSVICMLRSLLKHAKAVQSIFTLDDGPQLLRMRMASIAFQYIWHHKSWISCHMHLVREAVQHESCC
jgi:hypothetical protein